MPRLPWLTLKVMSTHEKVLSARRPLPDLRHPIMYALRHRPTPPHSRTKATQSRHGSLVLGCPLFNSFANVNVHQPHLVLVPLMSANSVMTKAAYISTSCRFGRLRVVRAPRVGQFGWLCGRLTWSTLSHCSPLLPRFLSTGYKTAYLWTMPRHLPNHSLFPTPLAFDPGSIPVSCAPTFTSVLHSDLVSSPRSDRLLTRPA